MFVLDGVGLAGALVVVGGTEEWDGEALVGEAEVGALVVAGAEDGVTGAVDAVALGVGDLLGDFVGLTDIDADAKVDERTADAVTVMLSALPLPVAEADAATTLPAGAPVPPPMLP